MRAATKRRCKVTNARTQSQCCLLAAGFALAVISLLLLKQNGVLCLTNERCSETFEGTVAGSVKGGVASALQGQKGFRLITGHLGISKKLLSL